MLIVCNLPENFFREHFKDDKDANALIELKLQFRFVIILFNSSICTCIIQYSLICRLLKLVSQNVCRGVCLKLPFLTHTFFLSVDEQSVVY